MIIQRYLAKEVIATVLSVTVVLLFIFVSNQFVRYLGDAAAGKLLGTVLPRLMVLYIPYLLGFLLPLGLFLGILLVYGRLYNDSEMTALMACGMSKRQLLLMTLKIAFVFMLLVSFLTLWLDPRLLLYRYRILTESDNATVVQTLMPGRFQADPSGHQVYYVEHVSRDHKNLTNIFVAQQKVVEGDPTSNQWTVISATGGYSMRDPKTHDEFLIATKGFRYLGVPGAPDFHIGQFEKYGVRIMTHHNESRSKWGTISLQELMHEMKRGDPVAHAEFQWRFAMPLATFLLALLAVPLSTLKPRQGKYAKIFPSILVFMVYANMLFVARSWVEKEAISPWLGIWLIHGVALLFGVILLLDLPERWRNRKIFLLPTRRVSSDTAL